MAAFNRVIVVGNVTRDIELRHTPSDMAVCDIGLAVNDKRKNGAGEWVEETTFVDVTLWGRHAEVASEYLAKGSSVLIEGRLKTESWDDKQSGTKRTKLKVVGESMQMLDRKGDKGGGGDKPATERRQSAPASHGTPRTTAPAPTAANGPDDDGIPF